MGTHFSHYYSHLILGLVAPRQTAKAPLDLRIGGGLVIDVDGIFDLVMINPAFIP